MNGALKWSNAYNKTYNNKKGQQKQRCLYNCMKLLFLLSFCCSMLLSCCLLLSCPSLSCNESK